MLQRSVAIALATVASLGIAASLSADASAKPVYVQKFQSSPKVMNYKPVNQIIKPKYQINPSLVKAINPGSLKINPNLVGKLKYPPIIFPPRQQEQQ